MSYGQCLDPLIVHAGLAVDLLDTPTTDPSPPLPWYDRARLVRKCWGGSGCAWPLTRFALQMRHGDFDLDSKEFILNVLTQPDPEDDLDFLETKILRMRGTF